MSEERKKVTMTVKSQEAFNGVSRVDYKSSVDLARSINSIFKDTFKDYNGCAVELGNPKAYEPPVVLILDFIPSYDNGNDAPLKAFKAIGENTDDKSHIGPIAASIMQHNQLVSTKETFEITQDAIDILNDLLDQNVKNLIGNNPTVAKYRDRGVYVEGTEQTGSPYAQSKTIIHEYVRCVDIEAVLKLILPEKNEEGNKVIYTVSPMNLVCDKMNVAQYIFSITQHDVRAMSNIVAEYGEKKKQSTFYGNIVQV